MADIFISYAREDAATVKKLAAALEANGHTVWWDRQLTPGARYLEETEQALKSAKAVLVVWTATSIKSHWVADEAGVGRERGALVPISLDGSMPPLGFRQFQVMDFTGWHGAAHDPRLKELSASLANLAPPPEQAAGSASTAKPSGPSRPKWFVGAIAAMAIVTLALGAGTMWLLARNADAAWLENEFIPQMEALLAKGEMEAAYALQKQARQRAPESRTIEEYWPRLSWQTTITTDPSGAKVFRRAYNAPADAASEELGVTPLENIRIPYGYSRLRFEFEGYVTLNRAVGGGGRSMKILPADYQQLHPFMVGAGAFKLEPVKNDYPDKVRVPGWQLGSGDKSPAIADYFLDRTEVTNAKFKEFVDQGGYRTESYWPPIIENGNTIPWPEAMGRFVDSTGRPGPATWIGGDYPKGRDDFPVTGVSWYEATAYASFRHQQLPTIYHWDGAVAPSEASWLVAASNLNSDAPRKVEEGGAMSYAGVYDMFGNAREWTANASGDQRIVRGGGWNDPRDCMDCLAPPMDRSVTNGFRLAVIRDDPAVEAFAQAPLTPPPPAPWPDPVGDDIFAAYSGQFTYDKAPLDAKVEQIIDTRSWTRERITFSAPDASDRMILYLYLPKAGSPPYQVVINWPEFAGTQMTNAEDVGVELDFVLKSGRAVAFPVLWGTFQRGGHPYPVPEPHVAERDRLVHMAKDTRRAIDYLETRNDIDSKAIGFYAFSWGASMASATLAQEPRISVAVLNTGGIPRWGSLPEIDALNAAPRINIPVLMMKGRYDSFVSMESCRRLYALLGVQEPKKKLVIEDSGHFVPRDIVIRETLDWLDKYLGPPLPTPRS